MWPLHRIFPKSFYLLLFDFLAVSERGVVFFRSQDINIAQQKKLGQKLGELTGKPKDSGLHVHPLTEDTSELGDEVSIITSKRK